MRLVLCTGTSVPKNSQILALLPPAPPPAQPKPIPPLFRYLIALIQSSSLLSFGPSIQAYVWERCPTAPASISWTGCRLAEFQNHGELWPLNWLPVNSSFLPVLSRPAAHNLLTVSARVVRLRLWRSGLILINLFPLRFQNLFEDSMTSGSIWNMFCKGFFLDFFFLFFFFY